MTHTFFRAGKIFILNFLSSLNLSSSQAPEKAMLCSEKCKASISSSREAKSPLIDISNLAKQDALGVIRHST